MTVSSETAKSGPYTGNGVTTVFAYGFRILDAGHIEVIRTQNGADITVNPSEYTVSGIGDLAGGNVTFAVAPTAGQSITIIRNAPFTQQTDLENQGAYYAEVVEQAFDLAAMRDQQMAEELSRAVKVPVGRAPVDVDEAVEGLLRFADIYQGSAASNPTTRLDGSPLVAGDLYYNQVVGEYRYWDGALWAPFSTVASVVTYRYTATAGQTVFSGVDLGGKTPTSLLPGALLVHMNGIGLVEGVDFDVTGEGVSVTLTVAAALNDELVITEFQQISLAQLPGQVATDAQRAETARVGAETAADRVDLGALDAAVAATAADAVATAADAAATAADRIQTGLDADEAEAARDAAFVNANVYASTAAGLAATSVGQQFQVVSGQEIVRYRHDAGPVATVVARYPASETIRNVKSGAAELVVVDGDENVIAVIGADEISHPQITEIAAQASVAAEKTAPLSNLQSGRNAFVLVDDSGNTVLEVSATEMRHPAIDDLADQVDGLSSGPAAIRSARVYEPRNSTWNNLQLLAGVSMLAVMGQSNAAGSDANPAISTSGSPWAKMFAGGVRPNDSRSTPIRGSFAALSEFTNSSLGETCAAGAEQSFRQFVLDEEGIDLTSGPATMLFANHSSPGATIEAGIASGTAAFNDMVSSMSAGATVANADAKPFAVAGLLLDIGESNQNNGTTQAAYVTLNTTLRTDLQSQAQAASGVTRPLPVFINQMNTIVPGPTPAPVDGSVRPNIALAQLQLAREQDYFCLVGPSYHLPYVSLSNIHYSALGQKIKGAYLGRAMKRWLLDGIKPRPVAPLSAWKQGRFVMVKLDVQSRTPIVIDSAAFPSVADSGVQVVDAGGNPLTISSVSVAWGDTLVIELSSASPAPATFRYGWIGVTSGSNLGKLQGCVRDTAGDREVFDPDGLNYPLHNWMVACEEAIQ